jgi:hypothetical protein
MSVDPISTAGFMGAGWLWDKYRKDIIDMASQSLLKDG